MPVWTMLGCYMFAKPERACREGPLMDFWIKRASHEQVMYLLSLRNKFQE